MCTLSIIFRILVNGTYLIFPVIIEHCSISRSFHTLYIKLWHGILIHSMNDIKCLAIGVLCIYIFIFLHTNEIVGISIAYEDLIFISRQISCCEMGWSFLRVGRYI